MRTHSRGTDVVEINGFTLRLVRTLRGRKVQDLATALGCNRSYIAKIELGHSPRVSETFYNRLLVELAVDEPRALMVNPRTVEELSA